MTEPAGSAISVSNAWQMGSDVDVGVDVVVSVVVSTAMPLSSTT